MPVPARRDRHRKPARAGFGDGDDRLDGDDFLAQFQKHLLLASHRLRDRQREAVALVNHLDDGLYFYKIQSFHNSLLKITCVVPKKTI